MGEAILFCLSPSRDLTLLGIIASQTCTRDVVACGCVLIMNHSFNWAARLHSLSPFFVSMDTTKLGLMLQAMKFTGVYEIFTSVYEK